jgi:hypothetical protein
VAKCWRGRVAAYIYIHTFSLGLCNLAMLRRQAHRLLTYSDSLCGQVLKAKYFPHTNILHCTPKDKMSYRWRSILKGLELLKEGLL